MGETSAIEWTDATVNFWWGCTKVGPGCDHCYAESFDKRTGGAHWGQGVPRRKIKSAVATIQKLDNDYAWWAADASIAGLHPNRRRRVFIQSMSDLFDNEVPLDWFAEAWGRINLCDRIDIQIVTKRISMVKKRLAAVGATHWPQHAGLMITVVNQAEADRDIPRLLALKAKLGIPWVGLSMEPLLGQVDLTAIRPTSETPWDEESADLNEWGVMNALAKGPWPSLDWVIVGGESGPKARPMHPDWARSLRDQCQAAGMPFFFKQWGEWTFPGQSAGTPTNEQIKWIREDGILADQPISAIIPGALGNGEKQTIAGEEVTVYPSHSWTRTARVGKARAGRLLDGREWNDMPGAL